MYARAIATWCLAAGMAIFACGMVEVAWASDAGCLGGSSSKGPGLSAPWTMNCTGSCPGSDSCAPYSYTFTRPDANGNPQTVTATSCQCFDSLGNPYSPFPSVSKCLMTLESVSEPGFTQYSHKCGTLTCVETCTFGGYPTWWTNAMTVHCNCPE